MIVAGSYVSINMTYKRFFMEHASALPALYKSGDKMAEFVIMPEYSRNPNSFILKTDYNNYFLSYNCEYMWPFGFVESAWINC